MFQKAAGKLAGSCQTPAWGAAFRRSVTRRSAEGAGKSRYNADWRTLGITGAGRHTGVTHLAVWMGNYLAGARREKTAVLEWNSHGDFQRLKHFCMEQPENGPALQPFRILEVDYYAAAGAKELADCMNGDYRRILVDFGEITGEGLCECTRCDRKVIVGALSEWQAEPFLELVRGETRRDKSWRYAAAFGSEETRKEYEKTFKVELLRVPLSVDAFAVTRADMSFFARLLQEQA